MDHKTKTSVILCGFLVWHQGQNTLAGSYIKMPHQMVRLWSITNAHQGFDPDKDQ